MPSGSRALASRRPVSSCSSTSWWSSAQSSPTNSNSTLPSSTADHYRSSLRENYQRPNEPVLTPDTAGTTSHQRSRLPTTGRGTICHIGLEVLAPRVLTRRRLPDPSLPQADPVAPIRRSAVPAARPAAPLDPAVAQSARRHRSPGAGEDLRPTRQAATGRQIHGTSERTLLGR